MATDDEWPDMHWAMISGWIEDINRELASRKHEPVRRFKKAPGVDIGPPTYLGSSPKERLLAQRAKLTAQAALIERSERVKYMVQIGLSRYIDDIAAAPCYALRNAVVMIRAEAARDPRSQREIRYRVYDELQKEISRRCKPGPPRMASPNRTR